MDHRGGEEDASDGEEPCCPGASSVTATGTDTGPDAHTQTPAPAAWHDLRTDHHGPRLVPVSPALSVEHSGCRAGAGGADR